MTDEERQKLLLDLNQPWTLCDNVDANLAALMARAAEEIERLAAIIHDYKLTFGDIHDVKWDRDAQSDAEPTVKMDWSLSEESKRQLEEIERATVRPGDARLNTIVGAQSNAEPQNVRNMLEKAITASTLPEHKADDAEFMRASIRLANEFAKDALAAVSQSDAGPQETWNKRPPGPDSILHELGDCPTQSDAEPAQPQTLRDAAENLLIAIGMGWDIEGCVENLRAALAQSDAEPVTVKAQFEEWAFTKGHRNFTKLGEGYLLPEIQKGWLAFRAGYAAPPRPDASGLAREIWLNQANLQRPLSQEELKRLIETYSRSGSDVSAGLIEAAEIAEEHASKYCYDSQAEQGLLRNFAQLLRARAADRSEK